jgi:diacylglycerol kinase (ATP)
VDTELPPLPSAPRAAVVYNPVKMNLPALRTAVGAEEQRNGWRPSAWFETSAADDGRAAARDALAANPAMVLVAGGDGTLRIVVEELVDSGTRIGLVPAGTGNLFARNLLLPLNQIETSVRTAFTGVDRRVDVAFAELERGDGRTIRRAFLVMAGIGLDAQMAANTNTRLKKRIGWLAYSGPIARSIIRNRQLEMLYRIDDGPEHPMRAHTVIVGNCGSLTANVLLLPHAVIDDGLLDAVVLRPKGGGGWAGIGYKLAFNRLFHRTRVGRFIDQGSPDFRALRYVQAHRLHVRFDREQEVELDGDSFGTVTAAALSVRHHALTIRVPGNA